jgi:succinate-semialdehyde dehydrogenase/glutarate-semialdehyde dehydrogenase
MPSDTFTADARDRRLPHVPTQALIGGDWCDGAAGAFAVVDPATGDPLAHVADCDLTQARAAVDGAAAAGAAWAATSPRERSDVLARAHRAVVQRREELALLITLEMGKPLAEARGEVDYAADFLRWFSEEAVRVDGHYGLAPDGRTRMLVTRAPVGVCLLVTPWNFPLAMGTRKIAPALAAGCTVVVKPAPQTPLSTLALAELLQDAGVPAGVVNVVTTTDAPGVVEPLLSDPRVRKLSFTGSTAVGRALAARSAQQLLRLSLELGGNAPFLVLADADLDRAVEGAMLAKLRNGGEACTAANRFYVHESLAEPFAQRLTERFRALRVAAGTEPGADIGPLIDARQRDRVAELVQDAIDRGAQAPVGGAALDGRGFFFAPTVLTEVPADARLSSEEIFGPVAPITPFADDDEAIALANATEYGLVSYLYTSQVERALRVSSALESGMVGLNRGLVSNAAAPFGGIKASGYGREGGPHGIEEYLDVRYLAIDA